VPVPGKGFARQPTSMLRFGNCNSQHWHIGLHRSCGLDKQKHRLEPYNHQCISYHNDHSLECNLPHLSSCTHSHLGLRMTQLDNSCPLHCKLENQRGTFLASWYLDRPKKVFHAQRNHVIANLSLVECRSSPRCNTDDGYQQLLSIWQLHWFPCLNTPNRCHGASRCRSPIPPSPMPHFGIAPCHCKHHFYTKVHSLL